MKKKKRPKMDVLAQWTVITPLSEIEEADMNNSLKVNKTVERQANRIRALETENRIIHNALEMMAEAHAGEAVNAAQDTAAQVARDALSFAGSLRESQGGAEEGTTSPCPAKAEPLCGLCGYYPCAGLEICPKSSAYLGAEAVIHKTKAEIRASIDQATMEEWDRAYRRAQKQDRLDDLITRLRMLPSLDMTKGEEIAWAQTTIEEAIQLIEKGEKKA